MREINPKLRSELEKDSVEFNPELFQTDEQKARYILDIFETHSHTLDENWIVIPSNLAGIITAQGDHPDVNAFYPDYQDDLKVIAYKGKLRLYEDRQLPVNTFKTSFDLKANK